MTDEMGKIILTGEDWETEAQRVYELAVNEQRGFHDTGVVEGLFRRSMAASAIAQTIQLRRIGNKLDRLCDALDHATTVNVATDRATG